MWFYSQTFGTLMSPSGTPICTGYAGHGEGVNNAAMQDVPSVGPLPRGDYEIGAPYDSPNTGPFTLALTPAPTNQMFGRSAFRIHGDNAKGDRTASAGCIIVPRGVREKVWASGDHKLRVIA